MIKTFVILSTKDLSTLSPLALNLRFVFLVKDLEETYQVAEVLALNSLKTHIKEEHIQKSCRSRIGHDQIEILNIACKYSMHSFIEDVFSSTKILRSFSLVEWDNFEALSREIRYELLKNTIQHVFERKKWGNPALLVPKKERIIDADLMEMKLIFNFLDLMIYENRNEDIAVRTKG